MCIRDSIIAVTDGNLKLTSSLILVISTILSPIIGSIPVSYTHLDVYKRQLLWLQMKSKKKL